MRLLNRLCDFPIAAPSANPFAYISPTRVEHVQAGLGGKIDFIIDGGPCELGLESTIIDARDETRATILRPGALSREEIEEVLEVPVSLHEQEHSESEKQIAPGTLPKHYSPSCPLEIMAKAYRQADLEALEDTTACLLLKRPHHETGPNVYWLSESGRLKEIAANLFHILRRIDAKRYRKIIAEEAQELGLGLAINDRLRRASHAK